MMTKEAAFRAEYRAGIWKWYNGYAHVLINVAMSLGLIYVCVTQLDNPTIWEQLFFIPAFIGFLVVEWFDHKYGGHRRIKGLIGLYKRHSLQHHKFYTHQNMTSDSHRDMRVTLFTAWALPLFVVMGAPIALAIEYVLSANAAWIFVFALVFHYLTYEVFHLCCHLPDSRVLRNVPFINTIRRHHQAHHNPAIMTETNMALTFPLIDWLLGTSDLNRGLIGHLFNGYSGTHLKEGMEDKQGNLTRTA